MPLKATMVREVEKEKRWGRPDDQPDDQRGSKGRHLTTNALGIGQMQDERNQFGVGDLVSA